MTSSQRHPVMIQRRLDGWQGVEHVVVLDTEFQLHEGIASPVCLCAVDLATGHNYDVFFRPGEKYSNPFADIYYSTVFITYNAAAEWNMFLSNGWDLPPKIIDLMFEFRVRTNKAVKRDRVTPIAEGYSLIDACEVYGVDHLDTASKTNERENIIKHGSAAPPEVTQEEYERRVIEYCRDDVTMTEALFWKMVGEMEPRQALVRGAYSRCVAYHERNGLPLNVPLVSKILCNLDLVKERLLEKLESEYRFRIWETDPIDGGIVRKHSGLEKYVKRRRLEHVWPRVGEHKRRGEDRRKYSFSVDALADLAKTDKEVFAMREFLKTDSLMRNLSLAITSDGHNRAPIWPMQTATGRNAPKGSCLLSGPKWLRHCMQAPPGHSIVSIDVVSQENALAAAYADDEREIHEYESGVDPYLSQAIQLGYAPPGATKKSHRRVREMFKGVTLTTQYGGQAATVANRLGISEIEGSVLVAQVRKVRKKYWDWNDSQVREARKRSCIETILGFRRAICPEGRDASGRRYGTKATTLINWPIQATGAEILRVASILVERCGYGDYMCYPHHDAIYFCCPTQLVPEIKAVAAAAFRYAGHLMTGGKVTLRCEAHEFAHPESYCEDDDTQAMFNRILSCLQDVPEPTPEQWGAVRLQMQQKNEKRRTRS